MVATQDHPVGVTGAPQVETLDSLDKGRELLAASGPDPTRQGQQLFAGRPEGDRLGPGQQPFHLALAPPRAPGPLGLGEDQGAGHALGPVTRLGASETVRVAVFEGNYAYIIWNGETADNIYEYATDTYVVRRGKIVMQSFAAKIILRQSSSALV